MGSKFELPDNELVVARARKGDPEALEALYRTFEAPVFNMARRLCGTVGGPIAESALRRNEHEGAIGPHFPGKIGGDLDQVLVALARLDEGRLQVAVHHPPGPLFPGMPCISARRDYR